MAFLQDLLGSLSTGAAKDEVKPVLVSLPRLSGRGRITVFTSGKGGVGKSTLSSACAGFLAKEGRKTLLIDTDTGLRTLDVMMGVEDSVTSNLYDVLEGRVEWQSALITREDIKNLYVLVSDQSRNKESIRKDAFEKFLVNASKYFDHIIIDCPAGIEYGFTLAVGAADEAFVVTAPEAPSLRGGAQVVRLLEQRHISPVSAIINRRVEKLEKSGLAPTADEAEDTIGVPVRAVIPMDMTVIACNHKGIPLSLWDKPSAAVEAIHSFVKEMWLTPEHIWDRQEGPALSSRISSLRGGGRGDGANETEGDTGQDKGVSEGSPAFVL